MRFELKLSDNRTVEWDGEDGDNAAVRYVDHRRVFGDDPVPVVVATRPADRHGIFVLGAGTIIG